MLLEPRIGLKRLAALCRRQAMSLGAGVDVRASWAREANAAHGAARRSFSAVADEVAAGGSISDGLQHGKRYFPEFFRDLVRVGETSGHLPEVFRQLAEHYEHQLKLRRSLVSSLAWPLVELSIALGVVGFLIWLMGAFPQLGKTDMLGFGLKGTSGVIQYLIVLAVVAAAGFLLYRTVVRRMLSLGAVQRVLMQIPQLGRALETLAIARLASTMHMTLNSGMELRSALALSLRSTQNALYTQHIDRIVAAIGAGREIHESFEETNVFPVDFLDAVRIGEDSGQLVESMAHFSEQYQAQARMAMNTLTILLGVAITAVIGAIIIYLIYQIFTRAYLGPINDALNMRR